MKKANKLAVYLTYAGAVPFVFCALFFLFAGQAAAASATMQALMREALSLYGLIIAAFLSGAHWGQHLGRGDQWASYLPIASNINAVLLWSLYLLLPFKALLAAFVVSFSLLLLIDQRLFRDGLITARYFHTRCIVTFVVIAALIIAGLFA